MKKILVDFDLGNERIEKLKKNSSGCDVVICTDRDLFAEQFRDTEILITFLNPVAPEMIDRAPKLKWIQALMTGVDMLPLDTIRKRGIILTSGRGIHKLYMTEYAIAAMVNLARHFHLMFRNQMEARWDRSAPQGEIYGSTLGILGLGSIGREIAKRASCFGMRVIGAKRTPHPIECVEQVYGFGEMKEVFRQSDYIINLLPDTPQTREVINKEYFDLMKETTCFINMGRGTTVKEADLIEALQKKTIRALVSDVFAVEPLPADSPLWTLDNAILTPHICGVSLKYMDRGMDIILRNLEVYLTGSGTMESVVDLASGY
ncbi:MAG: D-2-hydroxyacid dehydrogenase [Deltaproteobacteria bacterium]|nr:D-2-hydroxyacid dehydrogenase [Deltaproteobacteria bacterium]